MAYQTDLEVILEFLEEHCRQESRRKELWENYDSHLNEHIVGEGCSNTPERLDSLRLLSAPKVQQDTGPHLKTNALDPAVAFGRRDSVIQGVYSERAVDPCAGPESNLLQHVSRVKFAESLPSSTPAGRDEQTDGQAVAQCPERASAPTIAGRKVRLFHFLFEMLEDPRMAHCVSWVPASAGVFRFSSAHKERVAELWGQRKGNRRPMTYQKMSRALRNYTRSGEIVKVRKKLTYQFSGTTLTSLRSQQGRKGCPH
ncbi:transcription factor Spi-B-like isoform X2 [Electrophorus electricus]|uniref:transcription factor Spi-B-like isoform X2 n=1 Tax=Electrophorus electricus TaxID=8005 RepID=UPI0015CFB0E8|nr:transcription factor Spi-B-like isoform X2 [Electrophorus electricus]